MAYRLGVDVGGTFTDLFLVDDEDDRQWRVKTPSTPGDPSQGVLTGVERICEAAGIAPGRAAQRRARHDRRHQRRARVQGRPRRPDHDAGLRPDPAPRALADAGPAGGLDHHDQARPAGARWPTRARRSSAWTRAARRSSPVDREQVEAIIERPRRLRRRVADRRPRSTPTSTARHEQEIADLVEELHPGFPVTISLRRAARVPRVRAHADGLHELLRAAAGRDVRATGCRARCSDLGVESRGQHPALRRGPDDAGRGRAQPGLRRALAARPAASPARSTSPRARASRTSSRSTWAARRPTSSLCQDGRADDRARDHDRPVPDQGPERRRAHRRRRRRLDRARPAAHRRAARRPAVARAPSPARRPTARAASEPTVTDANVVARPPAAAT